MRTEGPRILAIASGKGGVGKSLLAANVGVFLSTLGKRVILVDAALGAPGLHLGTGVNRSLRSLSEHMVRGGVPLAELAVPTPVPNLGLIAAAQDPWWVGNHDDAAIASLVEGVRSLPCDWVVLDLGPGLARATLDLFLAADLGVVMATPDHASIELMYRFVRAAFAQRLVSAGLGDLLELDAAALRSFESGIPAPLDLYQQAQAAGDPRLGALRELILSFAPQLVINAARSKSDMELGRGVAAAARRRLGLAVGYLGHLEYDEAVWVAARRRRPLLIEHPDSRVAKGLEKVTRAIAAGGRSPAVVEVAPSEIHYDLLEVAPTASFEDIRRANRRIREIYAVDSIAISGLYDPAGLEGVHRRLDVAYTTLMDAASRKEYDRQLFPDGVPLPAHPVETAPIRLANASRAHERPPMPDLGPFTSYSGALLRQVREAAGVELREIAERSKIGLAYLVALEADSFTRLPATVYVRGFLNEYSRLLGLPSEQVKESYLDRLRATRGDDEHDEERKRP